MESSLRPRARDDEEKRNPFAALFGGGNSPKAQSGGGSKSKGGSKASSQDQIDKSINDKRFGYFDRNTGMRVPALIDMINGGGMNAAGDQFEGGPYSGILNLIGIDPYGSQRERMFMPSDSYRGGEVNPAQTMFGNNVAPQSGGTPSQSGAAAPAYSPERMQRINEIPTYQPSRMEQINEIPNSGPSPVVAAALERSQNANRMMSANNPMSAPPLPSRNNMEPQGPYAGMPAPQAPQALQAPAEPLSGQEFREKLLATTGMTILEFAQLPQAQQSQLIEAVRQGR